MKFENGCGNCVDCGNSCDIRAKRCKSCSIRERHKTKTLGYYRRGLPVSLDSKAFFRCPGSRGYKGGKGFEGTYKHEHFGFDIKCPEGFVRHHIVYDDSNPNLGIVFVTKAAHNKIHILRAKIREGRYNGN